MAKLTNGEEGSLVLIKSHTATGSSAAFYPNTDVRKSHGGRFNFVVSGTFVGTVVVEATFDNGTTWVPAYTASGGAASLTAPGVLQLIQIERGVGYRTTFTRTSGTAVARLSQ